ncbi:hypothetical protein GCM10027073_33040 [Streptomyces chlorus]
MGPWLPSREPFVSSGKGRAEQSTSQAFTGFDPLAGDADADALTPQPFSQVGAGRREASARAARRATDLAQEYTGLLTTGPTAGALLPPDTAPL